MDIKTFKDKLLKKAIEKGFSKAEFFYQQINTKTVNVYKGQVEKIQNNIGGGFSFRGLYNENMGYYYSEVLNEEQLDYILEQAMENAQIISSREKELIYKGDKEYPVVNVYNPHLEKISVDDRIEACLKMEKTVLAYDSRVQAVNSSCITVGKSYTYIANTEGLDVNEGSSYLLAYVSCMAQQGESIKENGEIFIGRSWEELDPVKIGTRAAEKTVDSLNSTSVTSDSYGIIMENKCFADLMGCYVSNFYGENVLKGFSLLADKINTKIGSEQVTLVDEPLLEGGYSTTAFDSEGVATKNKVLVEKGVLKSYLHNLKSAAAMGQEPTGNGFKASFKGSVNTSETNLYIKPDKYSLEELTAKMGNGLLICEISGLHAGANSISGDFSLLAEGFRVENGRITTGVEQITIAGNFYDLLKDILAVGSDLEFNSSAIGSPSVYIKELSVAGA